ncbi:MAG: DUF5689 domain-containing protein [Bacteroidota bacterium]|nr:DUF5689 domain-containing protein [Bacteroidota bacterium]
MKKIKDIFRLAAVLAILLFAISCTDNNETPPPVEEFVPGETVTVQQVKALYADQLAISDYTKRHPVEIENDWALRGIITASDKEDGNFYKEAFIEDATGGLRLLFEANSGLYIGDSVVVNLKGLWLGDYGNFWQLGGTPYFQEDGTVRVGGMNMDRQCLKLSIGNPTYPAALTVTQAKSSAYLGRLVKLDGVQFTDAMTGLTWANAVEMVTENRTLEDCNDKTITVRTSGYSSATGKVLPSGNGSITGIVTIFNGTYQFLVRDFDEVNMTGTRCGVVDQPLGTPVETLSENFDSFGDNDDIYITGWQNIATTGGRIWLAKVFSGNSYAQATGYNSNLQSMVTWLITRPVNISTQKILTFQTAKAYWAHTGTNFPLEVLIATDYNGSNISTATWTPVTAVLAKQSDPDHTFISSGNVNLPVSAGKSAVIAFRYTGSNTESTSYRIDNIAVSAAR